MTPLIYFSNMDADRPMPATAIRHFYRHLQAIPVTLVTVVAFSAFATLCVAIPGLAALHEPPIFPVFRGTVSPGASSDDRADKDDEVGKIETVDLEQIQRILPKTSGIGRKTEERLIEERDTSEKWLSGPDGRLESPESRYLRRGSIPGIRFERGAGVYFSIGGGFPPGVVSISGERPLFDAKGGYTGKDEVVWKWDVPAAFRQAHIVTAWDQAIGRPERFKVILLVTQKDYLLLIFDATQGLVWKRNITSLVPRDDKNSDNSFRVAGISCSFDGESTLVAMSPGKASAELGWRLMVFDRKGKLVSQKELPGHSVFYLKRNGSGNSFKLTSSISSEEAKRMIGNPHSASFFLRRGGEIAGVFTQEDGKMVQARVNISDDDAIAVGEDAGLVFNLP